MITVKRQGCLGMMADYLMFPLMLCLQGTFFEVPQRTHRWNNYHLKKIDIPSFDESVVVKVSGDVSAHRRWFGILPIFHIPILGGWDSFVVLAPHDSLIQEWFVGWVTHDAVGLSRISLNGRVRLLRGPSDVTFFGVSAQGQQIDIDIIGYGNIGKAGQYAKVPLL